MRWRQVYNMKVILHMLAVGWFCGCGFDVFEVGGSGWSAGRDEVMLSGVSW